MVICALIYPIIEEGFKELKSAIRKRRDQKEDEHYKDIEHSCTSSSNYFNYFLRAER